MDRGIRDSVQNSPFLAADGRGMGSEHEPFRRSPQRAEFLVASPSTVQHDQNVSGRYAERNRGRPSGTQFENQAIRHGRDYTDSRGDGQIQTLRSATRLKDYDGGVDAKYGLTPSLTLDATYRTDFAQVEVDQQQVNLTRFNLFFPEKRDFFLENAGTFNFGVPGGTGVGQSNLVPFFSRTIGLNGGTPVPIVGGARVSGKAGKYDLGFLAMKTESLTAGTRSIPANNYLVSRVKRTFSTSSWVGGIVTNRDSTVPGDYNRVYGADAHFQFYDKLEFDSYLLRSETPGKSGKDQARRFQTAWRDDEFSASARIQCRPNEFQSGNGIHPAKR